MYVCDVGWFFSDETGRVTSESDLSKTESHGPKGSNSRSIHYSSGYCCETDSSSNDWLIGRKQRPVLSETPLPGLTPHCRNLPGIEYIQTSYIKVKISFSVVYNHTNTLYNFTCTCTVNLVNLFLFEWDKYPQDLCAK